MNYPLFVVVGVLSVAIWTGEARADPAYADYRADDEEIVAGVGSARIHPLTPRGRAAWPIDLQERWIADIEAGWDDDKRYGVLERSIGLQTRYPLITKRVDGELIIPIVNDTEMLFGGQLVLPRSRGPRRTVILVDASSSANALTPFEIDGKIEKVPVLEAERRALDHLVNQLEDEWLDFGIIAFGEGTWPVVEPGASLQTVRDALSKFREVHPRGVGRTDMVCALHLAADWLEDTPGEVDREVVLLTDGDLPHSGRFIDCSFARKRGGKAAEATCESRRNRSVCPAKHRFSRGQGRSDLVQLDNFMRRKKRSLRVVPLVFEPDRYARVYRELARRMNGELVRVPSPQAIQVALPSLVSGRVLSLRVKNETTGIERTVQVDPSSLAFNGMLPLQNGANDIVLRIDGDDSGIGRYRFRVYSAPHALSSYLAELRGRNQGLEVRMEQLVDEARLKQERERERGLEIGVEEVPASAR